MEFKEWKYEPAPDLDVSLEERLRGFPREPQIWVSALRRVAALAIRGWLRLYHRLKVSGGENLPLGQSFVIVANHQSHLDAPSLTTAIPLRHLHHCFPAAAEDYFFKNLPRTVFASVTMNAIPFCRTTGARQGLTLCRQVLSTPGSILILFPEGTRSGSDAVSRFGLGIGMLTEGLDVPVVPCFLEGASRAFPKGSWLPRPTKLHLTIGEPMSFGELPPGRETVYQIAETLSQSVQALADSSS